MKLLDAYGREIDTSLLKNELAGVTTTGVRSPISSFIPHLNPVRLAQLLRSAAEGEALAYLELAEEIEEKDCHYRSVLSTRKTQVAGLDITVEAASDSAHDVRAADLLRDFVDMELLQGAMFDMLDALGKGFSCSEIMWDCSGKEWMPRQILWRDPRWFAYDILDGTTLKLRGDAGALVDLAPAKFIVHTHKSKSGLPIRGGLARAAAWGYLFKNFDIKAWMIFCEVYGHPMRLGKYDSSASQEEREILLRAVRNVAADHAAIIPQSMAIDFIDAKAQGNAQVFERLVDYLDRQISKLVLGQTGTTDTGSRVGTADAHEHVRKDIETSDAKQLAATLNRDLVRPLIDLNLGAQKAYPRLRIYRPESEDITSLVQNVATLLPFGLRVEQSVMADKLGLPDPDAGAVCLGMGQVLAAEADKSQKAAASRQKRENPADGPDDIDLYIAEELEGWQPLVAPLVDPVQKLLNECEGYEEFLTRLPDVAARQDADELTRSLARALFVARFEAEAKI